MFHTALRRSPGEHISALRLPFFSPTRPTLGEGKELPGNSVETHTPVAARRGYFPTSIDSPLQGARYSCMYAHSLYLTPHYAHLSVARGQVNSGFCGSK